MGTPAGCAADLLGAIAAIAEAADVARGSWDRLSPEQRRQAYLDLERARKTLAVVDAEYLQARCGDPPIADSTLPAALAVSQRISRAEARQRRAAYRRLSPGHDGLGQAGNDEYMPCVRKKVEAGVIGADAVEKIDRVLRGFPAKIHKELTRIADSHIAELVEHVQVDDLDHLAPMLRAMVGIDDPYTDADRKRARSVRVGVQEHDGMSKISGRLTPHLAALIKRLAADHARPGGLLDEGADDRRAPDQRLHDALEAALAAGFGKGAAPAGEQGWGPQPDGGLGPDGTGVPGDGGGADSGGDGDEAESDDSCGVTGPGVGPDPLIDPDFGAKADTLFDHTMDEAVVDAESQENCRRGTQQRGDPPPRPGGAPRRRGKLQPARGTTSIVVVATLDQIREMNGVVTSDTNVQMSVAEAVERCDARNLFLQVMDFQGQTLYLGKNYRRGSLAQYLALLGEEGMSSAPGSSAPAAWCHIHHTEGWQYGGGTDLDVLTLVDPKTHANVDDARRDPDKWWTRKGRGPGEPRIVWMPPKTMDPKREPVDNRHPAGWANPGRAMRREAKTKREGDQKPGPGRGE